MPWSFRSCAEHYLRQWCSYDRGFVRGFSSGPVTCELLSKMCNRYGVARTLPGEAPQKYTKFAEMLNRNRDVQLTRPNVAETIEREFRSMQEAYGKSFLSAITKAFWMMKRHPVAIYDANARRGLQKCDLPPGTNQYRVYFDSWLKFFEDSHTQRALDDALTWLPNSRSARRLLKMKSISEADIMELVASDWFRNRVVDIRLFSMGKERRE
jgi:hypothetical protein